MRKISLLLSFSVLVCLLLPITSCATWLTNRAISYERGKANIEKKSITVGKFNFVYNEGGEGETVVLVHGFGADKDNWTRISVFLTETVHVVSPDLPGHGENDRLPEEKYGIPQQAERLHAFVKAIGLKKFHLVGNSMGGAISGYYASVYPEDVITLTLVDAAGVKSPNDSEATKMIKAGTNPLLVKDVEDFDRLMDFIFVTRPYVPSVIKNYLAEKAVKNRPFNEIIFKDIRGITGDLQSRLALIKSPTLIIWGDKDKVIDISSVDVFQKGITNTRVVIMKDCGHAPMIERPEETASYLINFWRGKN